jgi:Phage tail protein (Tail_P2_I)
MTGAPPIYGLLPEVYRNRDALAGGPLRALTELLDETGGVVAGDIDGLYRDWFVETCQSRILPYLADLVGRPGPPPGAREPRALVAESVALARRKGTFPAIEHLLACLGGWPVQVRFEANVATASFWPEPAYAVRRVAPHCEGAGRYFFHPLGVDCPLFAPPRPYAGIESRFIPALDAPAPWPAADEAEWIDRAIEILVDDRAGEMKAIPAGEMTVADLSDWAVPVAVSGRAVVDPMHGRFMLLDRSVHDRPVAVSFAYAAAGNVGGGPYEREMAPPDDSTWIAYVHRKAVSGTGALVFNTLAEALKACRSVPGDGLIRILDSAAHDVDGLTMGAAPLVCPIDPNAPRRLTIEALSGEAPVLRGTLGVVGIGTGLKLVLSGLWIDGQVAFEGRVEARIEHCSIHPVSAGRAGGRAEAIAAISATEGEGTLPKLSLHACLTGPLELVEGVALSVSESVIDGYEGGMAIAGKPDSTLACTTLLGGAELGSLDAVDTIFGMPVTVDDLEACRASFCFLPSGVSLPGVTHGITDAPVAGFESIAFGTPGYARVKPPSAIQTGASNGSAIGLFNAEHEVQRVKLMADALAESLPVGMGHQPERKSLVGRE